jgi:preprotein translocase subunit SecY
MTAGTMFAIWLGELISEYGIRGQGLSLIIFAGIVSQIPANFASLLADESTRWFMLILPRSSSFLRYGIVYVQQGRRNVPVMYPGRRVGNRMSMPVKGTMPLMVNLSGMIPLIFASAILQFPAIVASYFTQSENAGVAEFFLGVQNFFGATGTSNWGYWTIYFLMVVIFTFFYTTVLFDQQNYGENLKKVGATIPGVHHRRADPEIPEHGSAPYHLGWRGFPGLSLSCPSCSDCCLSAFNSLLPVTNRHLPY